jgi:hypothetical protein
MLFAAVLIWALIKWLSSSIYAVNNSSSLIYMGCLYLLAIAIYVGSKLVRRRQGMDLGLVYGEIPVE